MTVFCGACVFDPILRELHFSIGPVKRIHPTSFRNLVHQLLVLLQNQFSKTFCVF